MGISVRIIDVCNDSKTVFIAKKDIFIVDLEFDFNVMLHLRLRKVEIKLILECNQTP